MMYMILAVILCFMMTWGVGANDLANVMSTTLGSKALSAKQAMLIAIIFEFAGAFLGEPMLQRLYAMALLIPRNYGSNLIY